MEGLRSEKEKANDAAWIISWIYHFMSYSLHQTLYLNKCLEWQTLTQTVSVRSPKLTHLRMLIIIPTVKNSITIWKV